MFENFTHVPVWLWAALGLLMLTAEILGAGGFLLGTGVAALVLAVLGLVFDVHWQVQVPLFAFLSIAFTYVYIRHMKPNASPSEDPQLNNRMARLVGKQSPLVKPVINGEGRVQIHDAFWVVHCEEDLPEGAEVKVTGYDGSTLIVEPIRATQEQANEGN